MVHGAARDLLRGHAGHRAHHDALPGPHLGLNLGAGRGSAGARLYNRNMKVKTSVTIDEHLLKAIDKATTRGRSRSRVIEDAAREFLARRARAAREARDLAILNESADALNREMEDVLAYQVDV